MKKFFKKDSIEYLLKKIKLKKVVLCHGVYDLLHPGHIEHFKQAKNLGDFLIVSITSDRFVNKGPGKPYFKENLRLKFLSSIEYIDAVILSDAPSAIESIKLIKPSFYVKGSDYKIRKSDISKKIYLEEKEVKKYGGKIAFTDGVTFSSTKILNDTFDVFDKKQKKFLSKIKNKYNFKEIINLINNFKDKKVLIIGEAIIDNYVLCEALGKSGKDPILMFQRLQTKKYLGGSTAIAKNISNFSKKTSLYCMTGEKDNYDNVIKRKLNNLKLSFFKKKNSPTIIKTKFLDSYNNNKIFGYYDFNDQGISKNEEEDIIKKLKKIIKNYDIVVVSDYGHGFITEKIAKFICSNSKILNINAQSNAGNHGFHSLRKYKNSRQIIINESELRTELRDKISDLRKLMLKLDKIVKFEKCIVTRGKNGAILYNKKSKSFYECPAFGIKVVDKIGAGDAMLAIISLMAEEKNIEDLLIFLGSVASSMIVESLANAVSIKKLDFINSIKTYLK